MDFGSKIRLVRQSKGYSLRKLGELTGVSYAYLSQLERGQGSRPSVPFLEKLADALGLNKDRVILEAGRVPVWIAELLKNHPRECLQELEILKLRVED